LIFEDSPVKALSRDADVWTAATPRGRVDASRVILAVNGHAQSFGFFKRRLMHIYLYASMTRPLSDDEEKRLGGEQIWGFTPADPMGTTVRKIAGTGGTRIVIRNGVTWNPSMQADERTVAKIGAHHDRSFRARFPMLGDVGFEHRWGGLLCLTRNAVSAFGEVERGLYSACCQNGLGAARGTLSGMLTADLASGKTSEYLNFLLSEAEPKRLPPEPFASIGAKAVLRLNTFKAGAEL